MTPQETKITAIEQKKRAKSAKAVGKHPVTGNTIYEYEHEDIGWFVQVERNPEWFFVGFEKPDLVVGQEVTIRIAPK